MACTPTVAEVAVKANGFFRSTFECLVAKAAGEACTLSVADGVCEGQGLYSVGGRCAASTAGVSRGDVCRGDEDYTNGSWCLEPSTACPSPSRPASSAASPWKRRVGRPLLPFVTWPPAWSALTEPAPPQGTGRCLAPGRPATGRSASPVRLKWSKRWGRCFPAGIPLF